MNLFCSRWWWPGVSFRDACGMVRRSGGKRSPVSICAQCQRAGQGSTLTQDTDSKWYCAGCWIEEYGHPPHSAGKPIGAVSAAAAVTPQAIRRVTLRGGVLDSEVVGSVEAIVQQTNCVGCDAKGLSAAIASALPYGCPYKHRRRMAPQSNFAIAEDRPQPGKLASIHMCTHVYTHMCVHTCARMRLHVFTHVYTQPGTIDCCRRGPSTAGLPTVINLFAQYQMGAPSTRASRMGNPPFPPGVVDSAAQREEWFQQCLNAIAVLTPKPASLAFPSHIGCGLAKGHWPTFERMIEDFATANPDVRVTIATLAGNIP